MAWRCDAAVDEAHTRGRASFLVARHGLHRSLQTIEEAFARIGCVQVDPLAATGMRNHDLVLAARVRAAIHAPGFSSQRFSPGCGTATSSSRAAT